MAVGGDGSKSLLICTDPKSCLSFPSAACVWGSVQSGAHTSRGSLPQDQAQANQAAALKAVMHLACCCSGNISMLKAFQKHTAQLHQVS